MTRFKDKQKAIELRLNGSSYSQIKQALGISKSTLSNWLSSYPLPAERIKELRDNNPRRIENYINTMRTKRVGKFNLALEKVSKDMGVITNRELFVAGFFLYWAEGGKTKLNTLSLSNSDPSMLKVFIRWLELLGIQKNQLKIRLHMYRDMDPEKIINFWQEKLCVKRSQFLRPYIKDSRLSDLTYKNGFGHGTCNIVVDKAVFARYILMGIKYLVSELTGEKIELRV